MGGRLKLTPLTGTIGARVSGVDLRHEVPAAVADEIREAFWRHFVLVFSHETDVGIEEQNRLASLFGEPEPVPSIGFLGSLGATLTLGSGSKIVEPDAADSNGSDPYADELRDAGFGSDFDGWHTDSPAAPWLPRVGVLRSEIIAPVGGDTGFSGLCAAYDALSTKMKSWLEDLTALCVPHPGEKEALRVTEYGPEVERCWDAEFGHPIEWPIVIEHPETGRRALFVTPGFTSHVRGLERRESNALLRFLFLHVMSFRFLYRHHWQTGDLVLWDELTTLHRAPDDYGPHPRQVVRVNAGRVVPSGPPRKQSNSTTPASVTLSAEAR
jgi:taurine dioxygenase